MKTVQEKGLKRKLYFWLILINLILIFCTYKIMPVVQNYPPNSENMGFQKSVEQFSHIEQYVMIFVIGTSIQILTLNRSIKKICKFLNKHSKDEEVSYEEILEVRKDCINVPYKFYIMQMIVVLVLGMALTLLIISDGLAIFKFFLMIFAITSLIEIIQFILIQRELKKVMEKTYNCSEKYEKGVGIRLSYSTNLILQIIPFIAVSIIIISLVGYAKATEEYAKSKENYYKAYLDTKTFNSLNIDQIKKELATIPLNSKDDYFFVISSDYKQTFISKKGKTISDFFIKYLDFYFKEDKGIVYEFYGTEEQAYTMKIQDSLGKTWYLGFEYSTADTSLMTFYVSIIVGSLLIYTLFIYILAKNISNNIEDVSNSLKDIVDKNEIKGKRKLPIFSNDEIGDLSYYYNKIEELTEKHERELKDNEYVMQRQAQFSILGEFAGGIAHDLNSPLSAVRLDIGTLGDYILSNEVQAKPEIKETLKEMLENIDKSLIKMGKTVEGVRNQIRSTGDSEKETFSFVELLDGIEILFGSILRKNNCQLIYDKEQDYQIYGEKNKLDRVIGNIIKNSIDAYVSKNIKGKIEVSISKVENNYLIKIKDYAGGISEDVKETLFKEMKTTKGENGTGFGLYYSNTIIESSFKGKMYFETEKNSGTTFYIELPIKYNIKEEN